jgi:hypothetical protein
MIQVMGAFGLLDWLGARFENYEPFISLIFQIFGGRGKPRIWGPPVCVCIYIYIYIHTYKFSSYLAVDTISLRYRKHSFNNV